MTRVSNRAHRERLHRKDPHCYWCKCVTVLRDITKCTGAPPPDTATLDHLRPRHHSGRHNPPTEGERRVVIACWKCNNARDQIEYGAVPLEVRRENAGTKMTATLAEARSAFAHVQKEAESAADYVARIEAAVHDFKAASMSETEFAHWMRCYASALRARTDAIRGCAGGMVDRIDRTEYTEPAEPALTAQSN